MNKNEPVNARIRLSIAQWPDDAPRGSVSTLCAEHEITRKTFYAIRARARDEGQAAALEPRSRRPKTSPMQLTEERKQEALKFRAALESSGAVCVHDKMLSLGMRGPSVASLARGSSGRKTWHGPSQTRNPGPRTAGSSTRRRTPAGSWQLDATEYVLAGGRKYVIFQLEENHSRLAIASHVASGETGEAAIAVVEKGIFARGVPQRLVTDYADNGARSQPLAAWDRRPTGRLRELARGQGDHRQPVQADHPGKNAFSADLVSLAGKQPLAQSHGELQAQVDRFDHVYNTERPHQGLPGRITAQQSWNATTVAAEPRPSPILPKTNPPEAITLSVAQHLKGTVEQEAAAIATGTAKEDTWRPWAWGGSPVASSIPPAPEAGS